MGEVLEKCPKEKNNSYTHAMQGNYSDLKRVSDVALCYTCVGQTIDETSSIKYGTIRELANDTKSTRIPKDPRHELCVSIALFA
jgi:hypothetical protein